MNFEFIPVESSMIEAVAYEPSTQTLRVRFKTDGSTYEYDDVPVEEFEKLLSADSKGSYFYRNIRTGYEYRRL